MPPFTATLGLLTALLLPVHAAHAQTGSDPERGANPPPVAQAVDKPRPVEKNQPGESLQAAGAPSADQRPAGDRAAADLPATTDRAVDTPYASVRKVPGTFEQVREALQFAISGQGLVINATGHVGEMLERTGQAMPGATRLYSQAENVEFCSAGLSRRMMAADPRNLVFCPYVIAYWTLPDDPKHVYVGFRKPLAPGAPAATQAVLKEVEALLQEIVDETAGQ